MAKAIQKFDVWFVSANTVYREVPFNVVADWAQQGRLIGSDQIRAGGTKDWGPLSEHEQLGLYLTVEEPEENQVEEMVSSPAPRVTTDNAVSLPPPEYEFAHRRRPEDEDDDVDMIPLIDISLVLLVFFMMTATVSSVSKVLVPETVNVSEINESNKAINISIDQTSDGSPVFAVSRGNSPPAADDKSLTNESALFERFDAQMRNVSTPIEVRIAAHRDMPCEVIERVSTEVEKRRSRGVLITSILAEVSERTTNE